MIIWEKNINNNNYQIKESDIDYIVFKNGIKKQTIRKKRSVLNLLRQKIERNLYE